MKLSIYNWQKIVINLLTKSDKNHINKETNYLLLK